MRACQVVARGLIWGAPEFRVTSTFGFGDCSECCWHVLVGGHRALGTFLSSEGMRGAEDCAGDVPRATPPHPCPAGDMLPRALGLSLMMAS